MNDLPESLYQPPSGSLTTLARNFFDPLLTLYKHSPGAASLAFADRSNLLNPDILPAIAHFRSLESKDRESLAQYLINKYQTDGAVRGTQIIQDALTARSTNHEANLTRRVEIEGMRDLGVKKLEMDGLRDTYKLMYSARVAMMNDQQRTARYLSDNQLRAAHLEAEAYLEGLKTISQLEAHTTIVTSKHQMETRINTALIAFAEKIQLAEIHRQGGRDLARADVTKHYLTLQTDLFINALRLRNEVTLAEISLKGKEVDAKSRDFAQEQETLRRGMETLQAGIKMGMQRIHLTVKSGGVETELILNAE